MVSKFERCIPILTKMFPNIDLIQTASRFDELGKDGNRLINDCLDRGYPKQTATSTSLTSADFLKTDQEVPPTYQTFALIFLQNEFPKLKTDFLRSKLEEQNFHIYPVFRLIFKKYWLCDCVVHPEDKDGKDVYELENEVKENYCEGSCAKKEFIVEQFRAIQEYSLLTEELKHISVKRQSYQTKVAAIKNLINERQRVFDVYLEEKNKLPFTLDTDIIKYPLAECPTCSNHHLPKEIAKCSFNHSVCRYCLREEILTNYLAKFKSTVMCMIIPNCKGKYSSPAIKLSLGSKKYWNFEKLLFQNGLICTSNEANTYQCPFCPFRYTSNVKPQIFYCRNPKCGRITCLLCNMEKKTHINGKCLKKKEAEDRSLAFARNLQSEEQAEAEERRLRRVERIEADLAAARIIHQQQIDAAEAERMRLEAERIERERKAAEERRRLAAIEAARIKAEQEAKRRKDFEESLKVYVENAMNASTVRTCPGCQRKIVKTVGCNHMTCEFPQCKCEWCYVCNAKCEDQANPSNHFAPTKPGGCLWYTSPDQQVIADAEVDRKRREDARTKAEAEWRVQNPSAPLDLPLPPV